MRRCNRRRGLTPLRPDPFYFSLIELQLNSMNSRGNKTQTRMFKHVDVLSEDVKITSSVFSVQRHRLSQRAFISNNAHLNLKISLNDFKITVLFVSIIVVTNYSNSGLFSSCYIVMKALFWVNANICLNKLFDLLLVSYIFIYIVNVFVLPCIRVDIIVDFLTEHLGFLPKCPVRHSAFSMHDNIMIRDQRSFSSD